MSERIALPSNAPLILEPDGTWWRVESGSLALFSVELREREPYGGRTQLFTVEAGELLFGLGAWLNQIDRGVVAVPLEGVVLIEGTPADLDAFVRDDAAAAQRLIEGWARHWTGAIDAEPPEDVALLGTAERVERLPLFSRWILRNLVRQADVAHDADVRRVVEGARSARDTGRLALQQLTSVLVAPDRRPPPTGNDLFRAAFAVGQALGITIRPLPRSVDIERVRDSAEALAQASHVRLRRVTLEPNWWTRDCGPLLAFEAEEGRPVALIPDASGDYELVDPSVDRRVPLTRAVAETLQHEASVFYRPFPKGNPGLLQLFAFAMRGRGRDLAGIMLVGMLATLLAMALPVATGLVVDYAVPFADRPLLWVLCLGLIAAAIGGAAFRLAAGILIVRLETGADADTQSAVWDRLLRLPPNFFRRYSVGDLESRVNAVGRIRAQLSGASLRTVFAGVMALLNVVLLFVLSPSLALVACLAALAATVVSLGSCVLILRYERALEEAKGALFGSMIQLVQGVTKLRVAAAEERAFLHWARRYSREQDLVVRSQRVRDVLDVAALWVEVASLMLLYYFAIQLLQSQGLSAGVFLAFSAAFGLFVGGVGGLSRQLPELLAVKVLQERAQPILDATPEVQDGQADPGKLQGRLALDRVGFRYRSNGPLVLHDVTFAIEPGEFVAIVGPSGSGKSTILRLLLGFEHPESGSVLVDGQNLRGIDIAAVRGQMGVVLQAPRLNAGSIYDNVACGGRVTTNEVLDAVERAGLAADVADMPMGLHTVVSEGGTNLSGGQRQRLLIARALLHRPRILLLDEATSSLDNKTQADVLRGLEALEVTRVIVAHRLETVQSADRILVISEGRLVEEGTFEKLLEKGGVFADLVHRQLGAD